MKNTVLTWFYRFICFLIIILYAHTFYQLDRIQFYPISLIIPLLSMYCIYDSFMNKIIESNAKLNKILLILKYVLIFICSFNIISYLISLLYFQNSIGDMKSQMFMINSICVNAGILGLFIGRNWYIRCLNAFIFGYGIYYLIWNIFFLITI